ncbi:MAG: carboxypeptidase regulatory-like domain-containing protein [Acidobacteria bacterium]|nr:carboxypeptidase regulatory-like domain-containing protein [Acidobacteriota bacterium]
MFIATYLNLRTTAVIAAVLLFSAFGTLLTANAQTTGGLKGKVKNMEGGGIAEATVTARLNGKDIRTVTSNNRGDFTLDGLESGLYNVLFDAKGYAAAVKYNVEVKPGKTRDMGSGLILMVDRGMQVIIEGSVYYKDGTSLSGAEVKIERVNSWTVRQARSGRCTRARAAKSFSASLKLKLSFASQLPTKV